MSVFTERLIQAMNARDIRQIDIVNATGMTTGKVSSYVSGRYTPNGKTMTVLARVLSVNPEWLAGTSDVMEIPKGTVLMSKDASDLMAKYKRLDDLDKGKLHGYADSLLAAEKYQKGKESAG